MKPKSLLTFLLRTSVVLLLSLMPWGTARAEKPRQLTQAEIDKMIQNGDRSADQGDYLGALEKYTKAYMGVVARIRGQEFLGPVKPSMFNREELGQEMLRQMQKEFTDEDLLLMDSSFQVLGLMSPKLDAKSLMTRLLTEEVAGFYDPDNKRMVLIVEDGPKEEPNWLGKLLGARPTFDKDEQKTTLAHELTHALQDQLYDLNAMEEGIENDDDMMIAFSALVEGDATLLMFAEAGNQDVRNMDPEAMRSTFTMMSWMMPLAGGEAFREAPPIFRESLVFPYFQGMIFAMTVASKEGFGAVHAAYQNPPLSSEQVLHPAKYLDASKIDVPQAIEIPDLKGLVGEWSYLGGNVLGELQTSIMFKGISGGAKAAVGWDGDRYEVFRRDDGKLAMVFVSVWDSTEDATEFAAAYREFIEKDPQATRSVYAEDAATLIDQQGSLVRIVAGFDSSTADSLLTALNDIKLKEKSFPTPAKTVEATTTSDTSETSEK